MRIREDYAGFGKRATNVSINQGLLADAKALDINLSATLERALEVEVGARKREKWLEENREAIAAYNERVARDGLAGDHVGIQGIAKLSSCIYLNAYFSSRRSIPCWLNVQSDLIDTAESRVVVPLIAPERGRPSVASLMPTLTVAGRPLVMDTAQITNVPMQMLGRRLADLSADRLIIIGALDFLTHGI